MISTLPAVLGLTAHDVAYLVGLFTVGALVIVYFLPAKLSAFPLVNGKYSGEFFTTNAKRRFQQGAGNLINLGFAKVDLPLASVFVIYRFPPKTSSNSPSVPQPLCHAYGHWNAIGSIVRERRLPPQSSARELRQTPRAGSSFPLCVSRGTGYGLIVLMAGRQLGTLWPYTRL